MSVCLDYKDTVTMVATSVGDYGDDLTIEAQEEVPALVMMNTGWQHGDNQDAIVSDTTVMVDPSNQFVIDNFYRLEEMYVITDMFDAPANRSWFKVESVSVFQDKLLCNDIDNVLLNLKKTTELPDVS